MMMRARYKIPFIFSALLFCVILFSAFSECKFPFIPIVPPAEICEVCKEEPCVCEAAGLLAYKFTAKLELEAYAASKGQSNYSLENWTVIGGFVTSGKAAVDAAADRPSVDIAVAAAKQAIDEVPQKPYTAPDGPVPFVEINPDRPPNPWAPDEYEIEIHGENYYWFMVVESVEDLEDAKIARQIFGAIHRDSPFLEDRLAKYDEAYFKDNLLIVSNLYTSSGFNMSFINKVEKYGEVLSVEARLLYGGLGWSSRKDVFIELNRTDIAGVTEFEFIYWSII